MPPSVRFAPSPTGRLHVGNLRTAILNWMFAKQDGGDFLLRFDDTDKERSKEEYVEGIREDLSWLGLTWDREMRQSERTDRYDDVVVELKQRGLLYPCYESADELDRKRKRQRARGLPPIYDRSALKLSDEDRAKLENEGRQPHWRFRLPNSPEENSTEIEPTLVKWDDVIRGEQTVDLGSLSDPVFIRADGTYLYTLPSVIDDSDMEISDIIRGDDHLTNTGVQIALFEALGKAPPQFGHHSLLVAADGTALSKRLGTLSLKQLRDDGLEAMAVASHAGLIGTSNAIEPHRTMDSLIETFGAKKVSTAAARFDPIDLENLNEKLLHKLTFEDVSERLNALDIDADETFWLSVRANLKKLADAKVWWDIINGDIKPEIENAELIKTAASLLPKGPWDEGTWGTWTKAIKNETGAKGRALFHPLRLALTGRDTGPEMKFLLPLIGQERVARRLTTASDT